MTCPKCGKEIEEGSLFCKYCFAEIKIVPTYDAKIEHSINEVMADVSKDIEKAQKKEQKLEERKASREERFRRDRRRLILIAIGVILGGITAVTAFVLMRRSYHQSETYYVANAYALAEEGDYVNAADQISKAIAINGSPDANLLTTEAGYLLQAGDEHGALACYQEIIDHANDSLELLGAYSKVIELYSAKGSYDTIAEILRDCGDEEVQNSFNQYMVFLPEFETPGGTYQNLIQLHIKNEGQGSIFYTLDGSIPNMKSTIYDGAITLRSGEYEVRAVFINHFGITSEIAAQDYVIEDEAPEAPVVTPKSGTYTEEVTLEVEVPEDCKCYYTTDGNTPTQDSKLYTGPIQVPLGTSNYQFILVNGEGTVSDSTSVSYTRQINANVRQEDGPNYILIALINRGEVIAADGTIQGGMAKFSYTYTGTKEVAGYGTFYVYTESLVDANGNTAATGRVYGVNVKNGTVNFMDNQGKPTPIG